MAFQAWDNPMGTDGFEFVEYAAPDPKALGQVFERMGFTAVARHRHKDVTLYRQGDINFLINANPIRSRNGSPGCTARRSARSHSGCGTRRAPTGARWRWAPGASIRTAARWS